MGQFVNNYKRKQLKLQRIVNSHAQDIISSANFKKSRGFIQHGDISVHRHSLAVARASLRLSDNLERLGIRCHKRELIRGALLHDYFLYDWHDKNRPDFRPLHGFHHAGTALRNASKEYDLTDREKDIIKKHMWPLNPVPPMCREAWIVTCADKYCSTLETLRGYRLRLQHITTRNNRGVS